MFQLSILLEMYFMVSTFFTNRFVARIDQFYGLSLIYFIRLFNFKSFFFWSREQMEEEDNNSRFPSGLGLNFQGPSPPFLSFTSGSSTSLTGLLSFCLGNKEPKQEIRNDLSSFSLYPFVSIICHYFICLVSSCIHECSGWGYDFILNSKIILFLIDQAL